MQKKKIYLSSPHMGGNEISFVNQAFETNWIAPLGPNVDGFENDISTYLSTGDERYEVAALSSGTAALHLALILLGVKRGDEVICQSMTFSASANPIIYQGATPVFVDSETETWNICPNFLEKAIKNRIKNGKKPKAIIAVHLYGMPYQADKIRQVADTYEIPIIEDSAEAFGSSFDSKKCGTFGDISILSFNGNKIITTSGGGALVTAKKATKDKAVFFSTQARDHAPHYEHSEIGYNYRMSNICAGIGRGQMQVLDSHIGKRREINRFYTKVFENIPGVTIFREPNNRYFSNHWLSCITLDSSISKVISPEKLRTAFEKENIESRPLWKPMHLQPVFNQAPFIGDNISKKLFETGLCLPSSSNLEEDDLKRIEGVISRFVY